MKPFKTKMMAGAALSLMLGAGLLARTTPDAALAAPGKAAQRVTVVVDGSGYTGRPLST